MTLRRRRGRYKLVMQPTAGDPFVVGGTFREVQPPHRLVYTWRWETGPAADGSESLVTVEFRDRDGQTELLLIHSDFPQPHGAGRAGPYQMGWEGGLVKLEQLLSGSGVDA
jgi:uncharacterized protein YndB with AHSA1/START domain